MLSPLTYLADYFGQPIIIILNVVIILMFLSMLIFQNQPNKHETVSNLLDSETWKIQNMQFWGVENYLTIVLVVGFIFLNVMFPVGSYMLKPEFKLLLSYRDPSRFVDIQEQSVEIITVYSETISLPNCSNPVGYTFDKTLSHSVEQKISLEAEIGFPINLILTNALRLKYGIEKTDTYTEESTLHYEAPPNTDTDYPVLWQYIWYSGNVVVTYPDGSSFTYPYRLNKIQISPQNPIVNICP